MTPIVVKSKGSAMRPIFTLFNIQLFWTILSVWVSKPWVTILFASTTIITLIVMIVLYLYFAKTNPSLIQSESSRFDQPG